MDNKSNLNADPKDVQDDKKKDETVQPVKKGGCGCGGCGCS